MHVLPISNDNVHVTQNTSIMDDMCIRNFIHLFYEYVNANSIVNAFYQFLVVDVRLEYEFLFLCKDQVFSMLPIVQLHH